MVISQRFYSDPKYIVIPTKVTEPQFLQGKLQLEALVCEVVSVQSKGTDLGEQPTAKEPGIIFLPSKRDKIEVVRLKVEAPESAAGKVMEQLNESSDKVRGGAKTGNIIRKVPLRKAGELDAGEVTTIWDLTKAHELTVQSISSVLRHSPVHRKYQSAWQWDNSPGAPIAGLAALTSRYRLDGWPGWVSVLGF